MTVYVTQEVKHRNGELVYDLSPAQRWGELAFLMPGGPVALSPQPMVNELRRLLADYSDEDLILAIGDPAVIGAAIGVAASMNRGRVRVLRWDKRAGGIREEYQPKLGQYVQRYQGDYIEVPMNLYGSEV